MGTLLRPLERSDLPLIRGLLADRCALPDAATVAEETLFGPAAAELVVEAFGAFDGDRPLGVSAVSGRWLRLLAVDPAARGRGVGTSLLALAEVAAGAVELRTLAQPGNYLSPGIAEEDSETLGWMERRGYRRIGQNTNLEIELVHNPRVSDVRARELEARAEAAGYRIERASPDDAAVLAAAIGEVFGPAWAFEVERALGGDPPGVHVAHQRETGALAAFAAHDGNNRGLGWFGPAGTFEEHRGRGLGELLLVRCLLDVATAGHRRGVIAWIGPREFYQRSVGVAGERHYVVMAKDLTGEEDE